MNSGKTIESKEQLVEWFKLGNKNKQDWKVGTEHEKFAYNFSEKKNIFILNLIDLITFRLNVHNRFNLSFTILSHNSTKSIPAAAAALGSNESFVNPGIAFNSNT